MSRSRSSRSTRSAKASAFANDTSSLLRSFNAAPVSSISSYLSDVEDGRRWFPDDDRPVRTITGNRTWSVIRVPRVVVHRRPVLARSYYTNLPVGLQLPVGVKRVGMFPVITCVRRGIRKAVLFATRRTGKGSKQRKRRRSYSSHVGC